MKTIINELDTSGLNKKKYNANNINLNIIARIPEGFSLRNGGLFYCDPDDDKSRELWISSELIITGKTRNENNSDWGVVLEFKDPDGHDHRISMPMELFHTEGTEARRILLNQGLLISTSRRARNLLSQYIQQTKINKTIRCVKKIGWYENSFVLPDDVIGRNSNVILQNNSSDHTIHGVNGTLEQWQSNVSKYCVGNSRLTLAASVAFATPLLRLINMEPGGFHFTGNSSEGKTTVLYVANSIWGNEFWMKRWRATSNGLEGIAEAHNDVLLSLDEIGELNNRELGNVSYMLANGQGKNRSDRNGNALTPKTWRHLFLSTGEVSLSQHIQEGGGIVRAGHEIRILNIKSDAEAGFGIFENIHGFACGAKFSTQLTNNSKTYYGVAAREYLKKLVLNTKQTVSDIETLRKGFIDELDLNDASGQAKRAANRFSVVAAAGELATEWGITGWNMGDATKAALICYNVWKTNRGGEQSQESIQALKRIKLFIEKHGESRFTQWDDEYSKTINRVGFSKLENDELTYYVFPEAFKNEVCKGLDHNLVLNVLKERKSLIHETNRLTKKVRIPKGKPSRFYVIKWGALSD